MWRYVVGAFRQVKERVVGGRRGGRERFVGSPVSSARRRVAEDLRVDPYLGYILLLSLALAGFWFWHLTPNFATRDERWRIVDLMQVVGFLVEDPSVESLKRGLLHWRQYGATVYIYGLVTLPVIVLALLLGEGSAFAGLPELTYRSQYWAHWKQLPAWVWTSSIILGRLVTVAFAVGCVYVLYRIGTTVRDRATGRLAALLFGLTWGFLVLAHEVGEDVPSLFFLLLVVYFGLRYVETGSKRAFYAASLAGGAAIAIKLSAGVGVVLLAVSHLAYVVRSDAPWRDVLVRPRLFVVGATLGASAIVLGYPGVFAGGIEQLLGRISRGVSNKSDPHHWRAFPTWWWIARGYLHGLGLPLLVGVVGGVVASVRRLRDGTLASVAVVLALTATGVTLLLVGRWEYVRTHHLLPTFPLLVLVLAVSLRRLSSRRPTVARTVTALLVVTTGIYAGVGVVGYANQPRAQASSWLATHVGPNETVETYTYDPQEAAVPHGVRTYRPSDRTMTIDGERKKLSYGVWMLAMPERCPTYIQLNYGTALIIVAPDDYSRRAELYGYPPLENYFTDLLNESKYPYEVVARFGPPPRFMTSEPPRPDWWQLLRTGIYPRTAQYGDPQDFGVMQYNVILRRNGTCKPDEHSPV